MGAIEELQERVIGCTRCPRLVDHCRAVAEKRRPMYRDWEYWGKPLPAFGSADARLLILGLAPAAHGGNRTGRMFTGDRSGDWVFGTLHKFGFASSPDSQRRDDGLFLKDAYVTAALRCAPPANRPLPEELLNCRPYLIEELRLLKRIRIVVALGKIAFDTFLRTWSGEGHQIPSPRQINRIWSRRNLRVTRRPGSDGVLPSQPAKHPNRQINARDVRKYLRKGQGSSGLKSGVAQAGAIPS